MTKLSVIMALFLLALSQQGWTLGEYELAKLIALEERLVARVMVPEATWSPEGDYLLVRGQTAAGEKQTLVYLVAEQALVSLPALASPQIALGPQPGVFACWQSGTAPHSLTLAICETKHGTCQSLAGLPVFTATAPLVWLATPERLVTMRQQGEYTALVIYDPQAQQLAPLAITVRGVGVELHRSFRPGKVRLGVTLPEGQLDYFLVDIETGLISEVPSDELPLKTLSPVTATSSGGLLARCLDNGLWVSLPDDSLKRKLLPQGELGAHSYAPGLQPLWAPQDEYLLYATRLPGSMLAEVWLVKLGLEQIVAEIRYTLGETVPVVGEVVWVCLDFQRDEPGAIVQPKWETVKACLQVTSAAKITVDGYQVIEAQSIGVAEGALERLTGLQQMASHNLEIQQSVSFPARQGLFAWSEQTKSGTVCQIKVTRHGLLQIGAPVPEEKPVAAPLLETSGLTEVTD